ncbi:MAG: acetate--CoA ligase family protein [Saprospiraceae bacterium]|nr:acetate--CoA ligase family protein [Saprospiraceae bacterium]
MFSSKIANEKSVHTMLNPKSIAVIGASENAKSIGSVVFKNLLHSKFEGSIYAVNPKYSAILDQPCYSSLQDIHEEIDIAVLATPAETIPDLIDQCCLKNIQSVMILSSGFNESGEEGQQLYKDIKSLCVDKQIRIIGPNCIGIINPWIDLNLGFYSKQALPGNLAFISQSGALNASILDWAVDQNVGFSSFVSVGSMMDVNFSDLLEYYENDDKTDCILMYIENIEQGKRFIEVASRVCDKKPIIALKAGRSRQGARVAASHTGALAGNDKIYDAAFEKAGILRVDSVAELFHVAKAFSIQPLPRGKRLAIVSNAGGPAVLATDMLISKGGELATLTDATISILKENLPSHAAKVNPIDVMDDASAETFSHTVIQCSKDKNVDAVIAIFTTQGLTNPADAAQMLIDSYTETDKPILTCWMGEGDVAKARDLLEKAGFPNFRYPENAVSVFQKMIEYKEAHTFEEKEEEEVQTYDVELAQTIIQYAGVQDRERLTEMEAKRILDCYHISSPESHIATSVEEAKYYAVQIGFPVVMKVLSPDIGHKIDVGGVILNINDYKEAEYAFGEIFSHVTSEAPDAEIMGVLVEKMVHKKYELLIGAVRDKAFGPAIMFGMGGSLVELWNDTHMAMAPLTRDDACHLIKMTKAHTLISGFRGMPAINKEKLIDVIVNFSHLINDLQNIVEVDINPFAMDEKGGLALDAHMLIK